jgi:Cytochrome c7 and related cytochrome c/Class III cytochrome C family
MTAKAGVGVLGAVLLAILLSVAISTWSRHPAIATPPEQPISFPHNVHAGQYKIDCQYCHADARRSEYAGLPSVARCMGCHKIVAADRPEIRKLADYAQRGEAIPWVRVYKVPEFTHFPHKAHIRAELKCQECHGKVEEMTTVAAVTGPRVTNDLLHLIGMRPGAPPLTMGWCIECHRVQNRTKDRKAPLDCVACHH